MGVDRPRRRRSVLLAAAFFGVPAAFADLSLERGVAVPAGPPAALAALLEPDGYRVTGEAAPALEFWFCAELPSKEPSGDQFNVLFPNLPSGALVGLVRVIEPWSDYRKQPIKPGVYTLRFGVQPADGDHMGQTYFRDFLMLVPAELDSFDPAGTTEPEPLVDAAKGSSGTSHPGVMALYQIYEPVAETAVVPNDYGEPTLALVRGGQFVLGIVLEGHGQELQVRLREPAALAALAERR